MFPFLLPLSLPPSLSLLRSLTPEAALRNGEIEREREREREREGGRDGEKGREGHGRG